MVNCGSVSQSDNRPVSCFAAKNITIMYWYNFHYIVIVSKEL